MPNPTNNRLNGHQGQGVEALVWDEEGLLKRLQGRKDRLQMVIDVFQQAHPQRLQRLESALSLRDAAKLRDSAHEIKGAAASLKAMALYTLSCDLESLASEESWSEAEVFVDKMLAESTVLSKRFSAHSC